VLRLKDSFSRHFSARIIALISGLYLAVLIAGCMPPPGDTGPQGQMGPKGFIFSTVYFILMVILVYFAVVIHPARLKEENQKKFIQGLKKNDEVVTSGGVFARVFAVRPEYVTIEVAPGVKLKVEPQHIRPAKKIDGASSSDQDKPPASKK